jgi:hypothetical protein
MTIGQIGNKSIEGTKKSDSLQESIDSVEHKEDSVEHKEKEISQTFG